MSRGPKKAPPCTPVGSIPKAVVNRLSYYLRELQRMVRDGKETTSSSQLGSMLGFTDAQVRKDLAYFGHFGYPGIGYRCEELITAIRRILGTDQQWPIAMIGAGNLGRALLGYRGFALQGFKIVAAFETDPEKIGKPIEGICVYHMDRLPKIARDLKIRLGLIAAPAAAAQFAADRLVAAGIEGIVNFAPVTINLPEGVSQIGVDLAMEFEQLSFAVITKRAASQDD